MPYGKGNVDFIMNTTPQLELLSVGDSKAARRSAFRTLTRKSETGRESWKKVFLVFSGTRKFIGGSPANNGIKTRVD